MSDSIDPWLHAAADVRSYRGMFDLAEAVVAAGAVPSEVRLAAQELRRTLRPVIDTPIASSFILKRARSSFVRLVAALETQAEVYENAPPYEEATQRLRQFSYLVSVEYNACG